ncbi:MAG: Hsp70 family protein [Verrucomicrobia bacterium]|nr:Hsp70 family protein [Verrucomicrobiota bacterium]
MKRTTIDFGIDLGTTNSAIAVLKGVTTEIIKNNADADITPSAVSIDKKGATHVGQRARNRVIDAPEDAYVEFKRRMGTDHTYHFKSSGQDRKPEELSAEILRSLKGDVQQRTGEVVEAAVITVPAAFELHQCDATRKAGELAGFKMSPLLQEPVAAALAYGFQVDKEKAYWLVYDFGGGTFDAAIIKADEGTIHVVNHGGDNFLGGSDIDWALVERVIAPKLVEEFHLQEFARGNARWREAFAKLKRAAELAKIDLSRGQRATLETCKFKGDDGEEIEFEGEVTRAELLSVAEPIILRSVDICKRVLMEKNLGPEAVERVILVGGPTLAPYFRELLANSLRIPLDHSVDPLTVVARGAAVFAGTWKWAPGRDDPQPGGRGPGQGQGTGPQYFIDLQHKPVGTDTAPIAGGTVSHPTIQDFTGFTLELANVKTLWRSGKVAVRPDGVFIATLHAEPGERNVFAIELFDPSGRRQKTTPDTLTYTIGREVVLPLINSMGIALASNEYDRLFEKGRVLPAKVTRDYQTTLAIRQGQTGDVCKIPVVEGENDRADRNRHVGSLEIRGENIRRDLPIGSDVEVSLRIDESRIITVTAWVPLLDEEFVAKLNMQMHGPDPDVLDREYAAELNRLGELKAKAAAAEGHAALALLASIEESPLMQEVRESLAAAKGDPDAAAKCEKRLLELKLKLDEAANELEWPALIAHARSELSYLENAANAYGDNEQCKRAAKLAEEVDASIREHNADLLRKRIKVVDQLYWEIMFAQPFYWVLELQRIEKLVEKMSDPVRAARLLDQGRDAISKNNALGLQNIVKQLWDLLPRGVVRSSQGDLKGTLVRRF